MPAATHSELPPRIVVLIGLPGSGKSTWAQSKGAAVLSSDETRRLLSDDPTNQEIHSLVFATMRHLLQKRLQLGRPVTYIDATNLTRNERRGYIKMGELWGAQVEAVWFDTPLSICKTRNAARERIVPDSAIDAMAQKLHPPSLDEGFHSVTRISPEPER